MSFNKKSLSIGKTNLDIINTPNLGPGEIAKMIDPSSEVTYDSKSAATSAIPTESRWKGKRVIIAPTSGQSREYWWRDGVTNDNLIPKGVEWSGTLGTEGTIATLPTAGISYKGLAYRVTTAGTYQSIYASVGDAFVCDGSAWIHIPSKLSVKVRGTLGTNGSYTSSNIPAASATVSGYLLRVTTDGTYQSISCKVGDLMYCDGDTWNRIPIGTFTSEISRVEGLITALKDGSTTTISSIDTSISTINTNITNIKGGSSKSINTLSTEIANLNGIALKISGSIAAASVPAAAAANKGNVYKITTAGNLGGDTNKPCQVGDYVFSTGSEWVPIPSKSYYTLVTTVSNLGSPMHFKGTVNDNGSGATTSWTNLLASTTTKKEGDMYKALTGHSSNPACVAGDLIVWNGSAWVVIPAGDDGVRKVTIEVTSPIANNGNSEITSTGTIKLSHANSGATAGTYGSDGKTIGFDGSFNVPKVNVDAMGHVTEISNQALKITKYTASAPLSINSSNAFTLSYGNGLELSSNALKVKAGTGITVDANGVSVKYSTTGTAGHACEANDSRLSNTREWNGELATGNRLKGAKNLTNQAVASPGYVVSLTDNWATFGYTTLTQLKAALELNNVKNTGITFSTPASDVLEIKLS